MENLKRKKERYYKDNLEVVLHMMPGYDKDILIEASCEIGRAHV